MLNSAIVDTGKFMLCDVKSGFEAVLSLCWVVSCMTKVVDSI